MAITYLCPAEKKPSGGVKVLYRHVEMLVRHGIESYIFHPKYHDFSCAWFAHQAVFRRISNPMLRLFFRNRQLLALKKSGFGSDIAVIPELWSVRYGMQCLRYGFDYILFVQNGYYIDYDYNDDEVEWNKIIYQNAKLILSVSDDTTQLLRLAFPSIEKSKIIRILPHVSHNFFPGEKEKIITFMPRKLAAHAKKVCRFLQEYLPTDWRIVPIDNVSEMDVAAIFRKSSVFLSFSDQEGFGLPPLEAAFSGNLVVGYTGQGACEYFSPPVFREVNNGDVRDFVQKIQLAVQDVEKGALLSLGYLNQLSCLRETYSHENELDHLLKFAARVRSF